MKIRRVFVTIALGVFVWLNPMPAAANATDDSLAAPAPEVQAAKSSSAHALMSAIRSVKLLPSVVGSSEASPAAKPQGGNSKSDSKFDIYLGYAFVSEGYGPRAGIHGWNLEGVWNINRNIGFTVDISGNNGSQDITTTAASFLGAGKSDVDHDMYYFLFGPKLTRHVEDFQIYSHFLVGVAHGQASQVFKPASGAASTFFAAKDTNFALAVGGGVDYMLSQRWGWRLLEVDFMWKQLSGGAAFPFPGGSDDIRVTTGLIFRWGER